MNVGWEPLARHSPSNHLIVKMLQSAYHVEELMTHSKIIYIPHLYRFYSAFQLILSEQFSLMLV